MKKAFSLTALLALCGLGVGVLASCQEIPAVYLGVEVEEEPPHEHSYTAEVTTPATCTEEGEMTYTCECGDSYTESIPATGHSWGAAVYSVDEATSEIVWTRTCEVCGAVETLSHEELANLEEAPVLEASSEAALTAGLTVDGATVVIPAAEEGESSVEVSKSLTIAPANEGETIDVTIVIDDGAALGVSEDAGLTSSTNDSTPGLIDVQKGASLTLELGESSSVTGASGDAYESTSQNAYHDGLISVGEGGSIVINADNSSDVTQTNPYGAVINIDTGGSCEINGGRYSVEGCLEYTVVNDGDMVINDGVFVTTNTGSSLIINGDDHDTAGHEDHDHSLVINGGEFYGGKHVVKNSLHGYLEINDGVFDGFLGTYYGADGEETTVGASEDLLDNEGATSVINGGVFGAGTAEMLEQSETGQFKVTITIKGGHAATTEETDDVGYVSTVTINGGTFYAGSESLIAFGDSRDIKNEPASAYDQLLVTSSVYEAIKGALEESSESYSIANEPDAAGYIVIAGKAADTGDTGNDEP